MCFLFFFIYISLLYTGLMTILLYTLYFILIYMVMIYVSFLSLYTCFFMYTILISISHMMPWWVLFKCFRKIGCELFSCYIFQEFIVGIDLLCNTTSGYKFSDLKLLSWIFVLLWFCHRLLKWEIVRDIFYVIG